MLEYALSAIENGISVIPSDIITKIPTCHGGAWKKYQSEIADKKTIEKWFSSDVTAFSIVTGTVSGNLELLDFDYEAELFQAWSELVKSELPGLFEKLFIETSQSSNGHPAHVFYRCDSEITGNKPLAHAIQYVSGKGKFRYKNGKKELTAKKAGDKWFIKPCLIETRGEGGQFLSHPTPGYNIIQGSISDIPILTISERGKLISFAQSLDTADPAIVHAPFKKIRQKKSASGLTPWDDFNRQKDVRELLTENGWQRCRREDWLVRPGKDIRDGHSGTVRDNIFYNFSSDATPFEAATAYSCSAVYALLNFNGDFSLAVKTLYKAGYGERIADKTEIIADNNLTDLGNAKRLVSAFGKDIQFCFGWGKWILWENGKWAEDNTGKIQRYAKKVPDLIRKEAEKKSDDSKKLIMDFANTTEFQGRLSAIVKLSESEPEVPVLPENFDTNQMLFNCKNGILDLKIGELVKHRRSAYMMKQSGITYDENAKCPLFLGFLEKIISDTEIIGFLKRYFGYCMTGLTVEQIMVIALGDGENGKSTLLNAIADVLGDYGSATSFDTFTIDEQNTARNDLAALRGARHITASEPEQKTILSEATVKRLTGGDPIVCRFLFSEYFTYTPTYKITLAANSAPIIKGQDWGIWRRIRLVPFNYKFSASEKDMNFGTKLKAELPGILNWMLSGCLEWQQVGLSTPAGITKASSEYRSDMDVLSGFINEMCEVGNPKTHRILRTELFESYRNYSACSNEKCFGKKDFYLKIKERNYNEIKTDGLRFIAGIRLKERAESDSERAEKNEDCPKKGRIFSDDSQSNQDDNPIKGKRANNLDKVFTLEEKNNICEPDNMGDHVCENNVYTEYLSEKNCPFALKSDNHSEIITDNSEKFCPFSENILPFCSKCRYLMTDNEGGKSCYKDGKILKIHNPHEVSCEKFEKREFKGIN